MKNQAVAFLLFLSTLSVSQTNYSVGFNTGIFFPNSSSFKLGSGGLVVLNLQLNEDITAFISSGYSTWGYRSKNEYNTRIIPFIFGIKYKLSQGGVTPYVSGELQYVTGETDYYVKYDAFGLPVLNPKKATFNISELGSGLGAGLLIPISSSIDIDISNSILLTAKTSSVYNIRSMLGLSFNL